MNILSTKNEPLRAAIYIRVSSKGQEEKYGPEMQLEETKRIAVERDGCIVRPEHIIDDSESGSTDKRPGWQKLMRIAKSGELDVVYFWKLDRMMRDEYYFYVNERDFKDLGVELRFATQDLTDPFSKAVQVAAAADERRKIVSRTYGGRVMAIKRDGKWIAPVPYGYQLDDKTGRLKIHLKEAEVIKNVFTWFVEGKLSLTALANKVYAYKIPTSYDKRGKKKPRYGKGFWSKGSLSRILRREYYATGEAFLMKYKKPRAVKKAELRPKEEWIKVSVPPIVSLSLFRKAQEQLAKNTAFARRRTRRTYLFDKKLRCGVCQSKLSANCRPDRESAKFYRGDTHSEKRCTECRYYLEQDLEPPIWGGVLELLRNPKVFMEKLEILRSKGSMREAIESERHELVRLGRELDRDERFLLEKEREGFYRGRLLIREREKVEEKRRFIAENRKRLDRILVAEEKRMETIATAERLYEKAKERLENASYGVKDKVLQLVIDKVMLRGRQAEVWLNLPARVEFSQFMKYTAENVAISSGGGMHSSPYAK